MTVLFDKYTHNSFCRLVLLFLFLSMVASAQTRLPAYENYILRYSDIAIAHMHDYRIPASITLAQGLLESGAGMSDLAVRSNNHFGIKCNRGWTGPTVYAPDDGPNDCFRKYRSVEDSYRDHSEFLANGARYRGLFALEITDYKGWARGLQTTGYATDRAYANKLIKLIEDYELYRFDDKNYRKNKSFAHNQSETQISSATDHPTWKHQPYKTHGLVYVIAVKGDTFESIANEFGFKTKDLLKYNEVPENFPLSEGDIVYFEKKKSKADKPYFEHVVQIGESMYSISQKYGVRVSSLYKLNKKNYEYVPTEGDVLKLR